MDNSSDPKSYTHKKFSALKRKRSQDEEVEESSDDVIFVREELPAKRGLFRPWLDEPQTVSTAEQTSQPARKPQGDAAAAAVTTTYHANMVRRVPKLRSPKAQQRRDRNTLACLLSRRARHAKEVVVEQEYKEYRKKHEDTLQQQIRLSLYYVRALQQAMSTMRAPLPDTSQQMRQQQHQ